MGFGGERSHSYCSKFIFTVKYEMWRGDSQLNNYSNCGTLIIGDVQVPGGSVTRENMALGIQVSGTRPFQKTITGVLMRQCIVLVNVRVYREQ